MLVKSVLLAAALAASSYGAVVQAFAPGDLSPGPFTLHDFESVAGGPGATYSAIDGVVLGAAGTPHSGTSALTTNSFPQPITITFDKPVTAFGLWFGNDDLCCTTGFDANLDVYDANGFLATISLTANLNDDHDQFLGFNSSELVTSVVLRYGSGSDVGLFQSIDDVQFNTAVDEVPEPSTFLLGASSLAALIALRRRS